MFLTLQFSWLEKESKDQFKSHPPPPPPPHHTTWLLRFSVFSNPLLFQPTPPSPDLV